VQPGTWLKGNMYRTYKIHSATRKLHYTTIEVLCNSRTTQTRQPPRLFLGSHRACTGAESPGPHPASCGHARRCRGRELQGLLSSCGHGRDLLLDAGRGAGLGRAGSLGGTSCQNLGAYEAHSARTLRCRVVLPPSTHAASSQNLTYLPLQVHA